MHNLSLFSRLPGIMAALALFVLMSLTFTDVVLRSVWNAPIEVAADMTRLLMAIMVFSVLPVMSAQGTHIGVDLLDGVFEKLGLTRVLDVVVNIFCGIILFWPAKRVFDLAERSRSYGDEMEYLGLPLHYLGWFIAVMTGITALALLFRAVAVMIRPKFLEGHE